MFRDLHAPIRSLLEADDVLAPLRVLLREVDSRVGTTALLAGQRRPCAGFTHREEVRQVEIGVPAGVELSVTGYGHSLGFFPQLHDFLHGFGQGRFFTHDPHLVLHQVLQLVLDLICADALAPVLSLEGR